MQLCTANNGIELYYESECLYGIETQKYHGIQNDLFGRDL